MQNAWLLDFRQYTDFGGCQNENSSSGFDCTSNNSDNTGGGDECKFEVKEQFLGEEPTSNDIEAFKRFLKRM